jgi:hypothetical protein
MNSDNKKRYVIRRYLSGDGLGCKMGNYAILYAIHLGSGLIPAYLKNEESKAFDFFNKDKVNVFQIEDAFPKIKNIFEPIDNFEDHKWCEVNAGMSPIKIIIDMIEYNNALGRFPNLNFQWFQRYTQWYPYKDQVLDLFEFNNDLLELARSNIPKTNKKIVGVSFRNEYKKFNSTGGHTKLGVDYYRKAFSFFSKEDYCFLIFADFFEQCPEVLDQLSNEYDIMYTKENMSSAEGMATLSLCDSIINSNSSFSFWASLLNKNINKKIICPNYFLHPSHAGSALLNHKWFPSEWTGLNEV